MYCDYRELANFNLKMLDIFKRMESIMESIKEDYQKITDLNVWDSPTRDYFYDSLKRIHTNMDIMNCHFLNIKQYLDLVVENFLTFEKKTGLLFSVFNGR